LNARITKKNLQLISPNKNSQTTSKTNLSQTKHSRKTETQNDSNGEKITIGRVATFRGLAKNWSLCPT